MKYCQLGLFSILALVLVITACTKTKEISPAQSKSFIKLLGSSGVDVGYDIKQTPDEGYIAVGSQTVNDVVSIACYKTDKNGNTTWSNTYGVGEARRIQVTSGGYAVLGNDGTNMKLLFLNEAGVEISSKTYNKASYQSSGNCLQVTSDGGFILVGSTESPSANVNPAGTKDVYVVRTNATGDTLWTKQYGGMAEDQGNFIQQKADGSFILVGMTASFPAKTETNIWIVEIDQNGGILGQVTVNHSPVDIGESIEILSDGSYIILGTTASNGGDMLLVKLEQNIFGNSWTKSFGSNNMNGGKSVKTTSDGGFILSGTSTAADDGLTRMNLIKTDANGIEIWNQEYGGGSSSNTGNSVYQTGDGGYISTETSKLGENSMILLIKTDENGDLIPD